MYIHTRFAVLIKINHNHFYLLYEHTINQQNILIKKMI